MACADTAAPAETGGAAGTGATAAPADPPMGAGATPGGGEFGAPAAGPPWAGGVADAAEAGRKFPLAVAQPTLIPTRATTVSVVISGLLRMRSRIVVTEDLPDARAVYPLTMRNASGAPEVPPHITAPDPRSAKRVITNPKKVRRPVGTRR
jgi:hypothetical protein